MVKAELKDLAVRDSGHPLSIRSIYRNYLR